MSEFLRIAISVATRKILDRQSTSSYAQTGEDVLIASLLGWPRTGFYVDVGCHHPIKLSNTYLLYLRGLRGVAIDANIDFAQSFARHRPRDVFVAACVGEQGGEAEFSFFRDSAVSGMSGNRVAGLTDDQYRLDRVQRMPIERVSDILAKHGAPHEFDLLSIDVEGNDFSALRSVDLERFRPRLIVIEIHDAAPEDLGSHHISKYLDDLSYRPVAFGRSNAFFARVDNR